MSYLTDQLKALATPQQTSITPDNGRDMSCATRVDGRCTTIDPTTARAAAEALQRALQVPLGFLVDDDTYGYDLISELNKGLTRVQVIQMESQIQAQSQRFDGIERVTITTTRHPESAEVEITVYGKRAGDRETFTLTPTSALDDVIIVPVPSPAFIFGGGPGWGSGIWTSY